MTEVRLDLFQSPADMTCWMSGWNRRGHISHKQTHAQTNKLLPVFLFFYYVAGCFRQLCAAGRLHQHGRRDHSEKQLRENGEVACKKKTKNRTRWSSQTKRWVASSRTAATTALISATTNSSNVVQPLSSSWPSDRQLVDEPQAINTSEWEITACSYKPNN